MKVCLEQVGIVQTMFNQIFPGVHADSRYAFLRISESEAWKLLTLFTIESTPNPSHTDLLRELRYVNVITLEGGRDVEVSYHPDPGKAFSVSQSKKTRG